MDPLEVFEVHPTAVSDSPHFLVVLLVGVGKGDFVVEVEHGAQSEVGSAPLQELGHLLREGLLDLFLDVGPELGDEELELVSEELPLRQTHLVHVAVGVEQLHRGGAGADLVELAVLVLLEQPRLPVPDRLVVHQPRARFAVAVRTLGHLQQYPCE